MGTLAVKAPFAWITSTSVRNGILPSAAGAGRGSNSPCSKEESAIESGNAAGAAGGK